MACLRSRGSEAPRISSASAVDLPSASEPGQTVTARSTILESVSERVMPRFDSRETGRGSAEKSQRRRYEVGA